MKRSIFSLLLALSVLTLSLIASPTRAEWVGDGTAIDPSGQPFNDGGGGTFNTDTYFTAFHNYSISGQGSVRTGAGNQWLRYYRWNGGGDPMTGIQIPIDLAVNGNASSSPAGTAYPYAGSDANGLGGNCGYNVTTSFSKTGRDNQHLQVVGTEAYITITVAARGNATVYQSGGSAGGGSQAEATAGF